MFITHAVKHRQKDMVIILCVCVCMFTTFWENCEHQWLEQATGRLQGPKMTRGFC